MCLFMVSVCHSEIDIRLNHAVCNQKSSVNMSAKSTLRKALVSSVQVTVIQCSNAGKDEYLTVKNHIR